uniref:Proline rich 5 like n=1 Tax=Astyanax mexicanus TaxID=7994 RepID=A0A3B1K985_ASTMX
MMGSFRRPRPRFMSSPVLSDLARFHASSPTLQLSNASVWNSVQTAVIKVFQGGGLQSNELYSLNESIRWLQRTELGSFITEYFQDQLLTKGLAHILEKIQHHDDENCLQALSEMWVAFFTEILPTLQAIFYPVQGQELTVRQMALLGFRDLVLMKLPLENMLQTAPYPPAIIQMLLILQGIHEPSGPRKEYYQLERLVDMVISPYLYISHQDSSSGELWLCNSKLGFCATETHVLTKCDLSFLLPHQSVIWNSPPQCTLASQRSQSHLLVRSRCWRLSSSTKVRPIWRGPEACGGTQLLTFTQTSSFSPSQTEFKHLMMMMMMMMMIMTVGASKE